LAVEDWRFVKCVDEFITANHKPQTLNQRPIGFSSYADSFVSVSFVCGLPFYGVYVFFLKALIFLSMNYW